LGDGRLVFLRTKGKDYLCFIQGKWIGFRSMSAERRMLKPRKKGVTPRLGFSSTSFGVWEQWELVDGDVSKPWHYMQMSFRSRNLPQVRKL
jgi:hypothetical protein